MLKRNELEKMTENEVKEIALAKVSLNGFNSYIIECFNGTFNELNCNTYYNGKYIDYITYPDYVERIKGLENYVEYVSKQLRLKTYTDEELEDFKDYDDYKNKQDSIWNILTQKYDCYSLYDNEAMEKIDTNIYQYKCFMKLWKNREELEHLKTLYLNLETKYNERIINDDKMLYNACVKEFFNHESPIDWEGATPALNALGINYHKLPREKQRIIEKAYNYVSNSYNW